MEVATRRSSRHLLRLMTAVLSAGLLLIGLAAPAQGKAHAKQRAQGCSPGEPVGAAGVGDKLYPTYGNGGYDVRHYGLEINYNPASQRIKRGKATISARATQSVCAFNLDLVGLRVSKVKVDGRRARVSRTEHEMTVTPKDSLERGRPFQVVVRYSGEPTEFLIPGTDIRTGFMDTPEGATVAGQPEVAAGWFPVNDHPRDKASYTYKVTVPDDYEVAANGFLRGVDTHPNHSTWEWNAPEPMASYLATIDIGYWDVDRGRLDTGQPVYNAVSSNITGGLRDQIDSSLARQGEVLDVLSRAFGPYPFKAAGGIVPNQDDLYFALETQTRPVYSKLFWLDGQGNPTEGTSVVAHELAHQWYGDDVAVDRWQDIWLNEGFATYAEFLWSEHEGQGTPQEIFKATYDSYPADDPFWAVSIADPTFEQLFSDPVYVRGGMALQALRNKVGDQDFFHILRRWHKSRAGGTGRTEQFTALAERISGQQLDQFFQDWLYTPEKPEFSEPAGAAAAPQRKAAPSAADNWGAKVADRLHRIGRY